MEFYTDDVSFNHEIDHNPKPEDEGIIKVFARIDSVLREDPIIDCPTVFDFSLPAKEFVDNLMRYSWDQLNWLVDNVGLNFFHVELAKTELDSLAIGVMFHSGNYSPDSALLFYITYKFRPRRTIFEEDMQVPFDESTIEILFRRASTVAVDSLSRHVYEKTASSSGTCTICLDEFKMGERVVTLPCGHEFDDTCILEWLATSHICPLCRFPLPCEN